MRAIFLILTVFASFMIFLGYSAKSDESNPLGNALIFGGLAIIVGVLTTWILFKVKESGDKKKL
jgi:hypothetical protein